MKKMISLILALMMFAIPCLAESGWIGGADGPTAFWLAEEPISGESMMNDAIAAGRRVTMNVTVPEITGVETGDPNADAAIVDFVKALGLRAVRQGDEYDLGLSLTGRDVLTLGWAVNGEDAYIKSNLIGGTIVLSEPEIVPVVSRLLDMFVLMEAMTEEEANEIKSQLPMLLEEYKKLIEQSMATALMPEDLLTMDYSAFEDAIQLVAGNIQELDTITVPRMCDPAVAGFTLSLDNEELTEIIKSFLVFMKENPKLMEYMNAQAGIPTDAQIDMIWEQNGDWYVRSGIYESKEEYRAQFPTMEQMMDEAIAELDATKFIDGEFVANVYLDEQGNVVYLTATLPVFNQDYTIYETDNVGVNGTTEIVNAVYTRQTINVGVSHTCNIESDGEGLNIDLLVKEDSFVFCLNDIASQSNLLTVNGDLLDDGVKGTFAFRVESEEVLNGDYAWSHVADEKQFKTDIALNMNIIAQSEYEENHALSIAYVCDYDRNGVDFNGSEVLTIGFDAVKVVVNVDIATSDPADSIMSGEVIRPAELDDSAFANWFVSAVNSVNSWLGNAMSALPESVLMMIYFSGNGGY